MAATAPASRSTRSKTGHAKPRNIAYDPTSPRKGKGATKANTSKPRAKKTATGRVTKSSPKKKTTTTKKPAAAKKPAAKMATAANKASPKKATAAKTAKVATAVKKTAAAAAKKPVAAAAAATAPKPSGGIINKVSSALLMLQEFVTGSPPKVGQAACYSDFLPSPFTFTFTLLSCKLTGEEIAC